MGQGIPFGSGKRMRLQRQSGSITRAKMVIATYSYSCKIPAGHCQAV
jgi:hypothetical protein